MIFSTSPGWENIFFCPSTGHCGFLYMCTLWLMLLISFLPEAETLFLRGQLFFKMQKPFPTLSLRTLQILEVFTISPVCLLFHCYHVEYSLPSKVTHVLQELYFCSPFELSPVGIWTLLLLSSCALQVLALCSVLARLIAVPNKSWALRFL